MSGADPITSVSNLASSIIDRIWPNKSDPAYINAQAALIQAQTQGAFKQMDADLQLALEQIKANAVSAAQPGVHFRDGAGWVCVVGFALTALRVPLEWVFTIAGHPLVLPAFDATSLTDMLVGLLGLGAMHTYQQVKS